MANGDLLYACGFERGGTVADEGGAVTTTGGTVTEVTTAPHAGSYHLRINRTSAAAVSWQLLTASASPRAIPAAKRTFAMCMWIRFATLPSAKISIFDVDLTNDFDLRVDNAGQLYSQWATAGEQTLTGLTVSAGTWYSLKMWFDTSVATFKATVKLGSTSSAETTLGSQTAADPVGFYFGTKVTTAATYDMYIDDLAFFDGYAEPPDLLSVQHLVPNGDVDSVWTPSTGATRWGVVDEIPVNTTDYISTTTSSTPGPSQTLDMTTYTLQAGESIAGIDLRGYAGSDSATGTRNFTAMIQNSSGANGSADTWSYDISGWRYNPYLAQAGVEIVDPTSGVKFTQTDLDGIRARVTADSASTNTRRVSGVWMYVAIITPPAQTILPSGIAGPGGTAGIPSAFRSVAKVGEGNNSTLPLTKPASAAVGDLLVMVAAVFAPTATAALTAGWQIHHQSNIASTYRFVVASKVEDGSAAGTLSWDGTSVWSTAIVGCYESDGQQIAMDVIGTVNAADGSNPITAAGITTNVPNEMVILCGAGGSNLTGSTEPAGGWGNRSTGDPCVLFDKSFASAGATGNQDWTAGFPNNCVSILLAIAPPSGSSAFGTPTFSYVVTPSGLPSLEAFGTADVQIEGAASQNIVLTGIPSAQAFGAHTVLPGGVTILPSGIASAQQIGAHSFLATNTILPSGIVSLEADGAHIVIPGTATILPSGIASLQQIGSHTLIPGGVNVLPSGIQSVETIGSHALAATNTISPAGIASSQAIGAHSLVATSLILPSGISTLEAIGTHVLVATNTISPSGIVSVETIGSHTIIPTATILPGGIASLEVFGSHQFISLGGPQTILVPGTPSAEAIGAHLVLASNLVLPAGIGSSETFGIPILSALATISPSGIPTKEQFGAHLVIATSTVFPGGIPSAEAIGAHILSASSTISPAGIGSLEAIGAHTFIPGGVTILPAGITSQEAFGAYVLTTGTVLLPAGITSLESIGAHALLAASTVSPTGIPSQQAIGVHKLETGWFVYPSGIASLENIGSHTLVPGTVTILVSGIASLQAIGVHLVQATNTILPGGIISKEAFGALLLVPGSVAIVPTGIPSQETFGAHALSTLLQLLPPGIASKEATGSPALASTALILPGGIGTQESFGNAFLGLYVKPTGVLSQQALGTPVVQPTNIILPSGILSREIFGSPIVVPGTVTLVVPGIPSEEYFGVITISVGVFLGTVDMVSIAVYPIEAYSRAAGVRLTDARVRTNGFTITTSGVKMLDRSAGVLEPVDHGGKR